MQNAGQFGPAAAASAHQPSQFVPSEPSPNGGSTTSSLRQFRKKDVDKNHVEQQQPPKQMSESHVARVAPHNHYPPVGNDVYRFPAHQFSGYSPQQVKYSDLAESTQPTPISTSVIQKPKSKDYMEMCNVQQPHLNNHQQYAPDNGQYIHKDPAQGYPTGFKPESHFFPKEQHQYQQLPHHAVSSKFNTMMTQNMRKYPAPADNPFLNKLSKIHPSMARSIMSDHHLQDTQPAYPPMDQRGMYGQQNHRYYSGSMHQPNPYSPTPNYPMNTPHPYSNYPSASCSYPRSSQMASVGPRYPHMERSISPGRRGYPENMHMPHMNYHAMHQKMPSGYNYSPQYRGPEYAQHYQHRRMPQDGFPQACRPAQYMQNHHQMSGQDMQELAESTVSPSDSLKKFIETWGADEESSADINPMEANMNLREKLRDDAPAGTVYMINATDVQYFENNGIPIVTSDNGGLQLTSENYQYLLKNGLVDNTGMVRIIEANKEISIDSSGNQERIVNLQIMEAPLKSDCMMVNKHMRPNEGGLLQSSMLPKPDDDTRRVVIHQNTILNPGNMMVNDRVPQPAETQIPLHQSVVDNLGITKELVDKNCSPINLDHLEHNLGFSEETDSRNAENSSKSVSSKHSNLSDTNHLNLSEDLSPNSDDSQYRSPGSKSMPLIDFFGEPQVVETEDSSESIINKSDEELKQELENKIVEDGDSKEEHSEEVTRIKTDEEGVKDTVKESNEGTSESVSTQKSQDSSDSSSPLSNSVIVSPNVIKAEHTVDEIQETSEKVAEKPSETPQDDIKCKEEDGTETDPTSSSPRTENNEGVQAPVERRKRIFSVDDIIHNIGNNIKRGSREFDCFCSAQALVGFIEKEVEFSSVEQIALKIQGANLDNLISKEIEDDPVDTSEVVNKRFPSNEINETSTVKSVDLLDQATSNGGRHPLRVEGPSVLLQVSGELMEITVNFVNGRKVISVTPLSDSTTVVDYNDNYELSANIPNLCIDNVDDSLEKECVEDCVKESSDCLGDSGLNNQDSGHSTSEKPGIGSKSDDVTEDIKEKVIDSQVPELQQHSECLEDSLENDERSSVLENAIAIQDNNKESIDNRETTEEKPVPGSASNELLLNVETVASDVEEPTKSIEETSENTDILENCQNTEATEVSTDSDEIKMSELTAPESTEHLKQILEDESESVISKDEEDIPVSSEFSCDTVHNEMAKIFNESDDNADSLTSDHSPAPTVLPLKIENCTETTQDIFQEVKEFDEELDSANDTEAVTECPNDRNSKEPEETKQEVLSESLCIDSDKQVSVENHTDEALQEEEHEKESQIQESEVFHDSPAQIPQDDELNSDGDNHETTVDVFNEETCPGIEHQVQDDADDSNDTRIDISTQDGEDTEKEYDEIPPEKSEVSDDGNVSDETGCELDEKGDHNKAELDQELELITENSLIEEPSDIQPLKTEDDVLEQTSEHNENLDESLTNTDSDIANIDLPNHLVDVEGDKNPIEESEKQIIQPPEDVTDGIIHSEDTKSLDFVESLETSEQIFVQATETPAHETIILANHIEENDESDYDVESTDFPLEDEVFIAEPPAHEVIVADPLEGIGLVEESSVLSSTPEIPLEPVTTTEEIAEVLDSKCDELLVHLETEQEKSVEQDPLLQGLSKELVVKIAKPEVQILSPTSTNIEDHISVTKNNVYLESRRTYSTDNDVSEYSGSPVTTKAAKKCYDTDLRVQHDIVSSSKKEDGPKPSSKSKKFTIKRSKRLNEKIQVDNEQKEMFRILAEKRKRREELRQKELSKQQKIPAETVEKKLIKVEAQKSNSLEHDDEYVDFKELLRARKLRKLKKLQESKVRETKESDSTKPKNSKADIKPKPTIVSSSYHREKKSEKHGECCIGCGNSSVKKSSKINKEEKPKTKRNTKTNVEVETAKISKAVSPERKPSNTKPDVSKAPQKILENVVFEPRNIEKIKIHKRVSFTDEFPSSTSNTTITPIAESKHPLPIGYGLHPKDPRRRSKVFDSPIMVPSVSELMEENGGTPSKKKISLADYVSRKRKATCAENDTEKRLKLDSVGYERTNSEESITKTKTLSDVKTSFVIHSSDWEDSSSPAATPRQSKEECLIKDFSGLIKTNPKKPVIDINELSPLDNPKDKKLQEYKDKVDSQLSSLHIQIPKIKPTGNLNLGPYGSPESSLVSRFLNNEKLSQSDMDKIRKIISYKRTMQHQKNRESPSKSPANNGYDCGTGKSPAYDPTYEVGSNLRLEADPRQMRLHLKKVSAKRKLQLVSDEEDSSSVISNQSEPNQNNKKNVGYSVINRLGEDGLPKIVFKRNKKCSLTREPVVELVKLDLDDLDKVKEKYNVTVRQMM